jgi:transcriptional regulator with XRE-family HTH domain
MMHSQDFREKYRPRRFEEDVSLNEIGPSHSDQSAQVSAFQKEERDQPSEGGLVDQHQHSHAETIDERYEDLEIEVIRHFTSIPDYKAPTDSKYPILAKTPSGYFCLDGWDLIESAKASEKVSMTCAVEYLADHSDEELAIRKTALRVKPKGGIASYGEKVRNVKCTEGLLLASNHDLRAFRHGGSRRGEEFANNKQENVIKVLALRLGKSISTINQYLSHARYLSEEMLNLLATNEANKDFFEKANTNKTATLTRLKSDRKSDAEITDQISTKMMEWLQEYEQDKKIERVWKETEPSPSEESSGDNTQDPAPLEITEEDEEKEEVFQPWQGNPEEPENDSFEQLKRETGDLANRLSEAATLDDPNLFCDRIMEEVPRFYQISRKAATLIKM